MHHTQRSLSHPCAAGSRMAEDFTIALTRTVNLKNAVGQSTRDPKPAEQDVWPC